MEDIKKEFSDKHFDERALQLISNFIEEFDDLFGKYVPRDEVIRRIKENLDSIVFSYDFKEESSYGEYVGLKKEIRLANIDNEEKLKSVFFHEMIHCITRNQEKDVTAFSRIWDIMDMEETKIVTCRGLTEGFTQYVTQKRNEKYAPDLELNSYPILSEQIENLLDLIGEDVFLDIAFNRPEDLGTELGFEDDGGFSIEANEFYEAFDVIWKEEKEIYVEKRYKETPEGRLMNAILGRVSNESNNLKSAKSIIVNNLNRILLSKPITTVEEFNTAYWRICTYADQLNMKKDAKLFKGLLARIEDLRKTGKSMEEILSEMTEEARILVKGSIIVEKFKKLSREERLELLTQKSFLDKLAEAEVWDSIFRDDVFKEIGASLIQTDSQERNGCLFLQLINGLAKIIKDRGYNIDTLSIEYIDFDPKAVRETLGLLTDRMVFNLYNTNTEKSTYLGTFYDYEDELLEFISHGVEKEKIIEEHPELTDAVILATGLGEILAYNGDDQYIMIDRNGKAMVSDEVTYCPSRVEQLQQLLKTRLTRLQNFINMNAPENIINRQKILVKEATEEIEQIKNKSKISPEEIAQAARDISLEEMQQAMVYLTNTKEKRQEALEKGIGYGK